jgi:hypothetical protein
MFRGEGCELAENLQVRRSPLLLMHSANNLGGQQTYAEESVSSIKTPSKRRLRRHDPKWGSLAEKCTDDAYLSKFPSFEISGGEDLCDVFNMDKTSMNFAEVPSSFHAKQRVECESTVDCNEHRCLEPAILSNSNVFPQHSASSSPAKLAHHNNGQHRSRVADGDSAIDTGFVTEILLPSIDQRSVQPIEVRREANRLIRDHLDDDVAVALPFASGPSSQLFSSDWNVAVPAGNCTTHQRQGRPEINHTIIAPYPAEIDSGQSIQDKDLSCSASDNIHFLISHLERSAGYDTNSLSVVSRWLGRCHEPPPSNTHGTRLGFASLVEEHRPVSPATSTFSSGPDVHDSTRSSGCFHFTPIGMIQGTIH